MKIRPVYTVTKVSFSFSSVFRLYSLQVPTILLYLIFIFGTIFPHKHNWICILVYILCHTVIFYWRIFYMLFEMWDRLIVHTFCITERLSFWCWISFILPRKYNGFEVSYQCEKQNKILYYFPKFNCLV